MRELKRYLLQLLLLLQSEHLHVVADLDFVVFAGADSRLADLDGTFQIGPPHTINVPEQKGLCSSEQVNLSPQTKRIFSN